MRGLHLAKINHSYSQNELGEVSVGYFAAHFPDSIIEMGSGLVSCIWYRIRQPTHRSVVQS